MKTKFFLMAAVLLMFASCGGDDESSATIYYKAVCSGITFENSAHDVYREKIEAALTGMQFIGDASYFATSASAGTVAEASAQCDAQAVTLYQGRIDGLTLMILKQKVYLMYAEEFQSAGIMSFSDLPFSNLTIHVKLLNSKSAMLVKEFDKAL